MFSGFTSQWTMPRVCAAASALATFIAILARVGAAMNVTTLEVRGLIAAVRCRLFSQSEHVD